MKQEKDPTGRRYEIIVKPEVGIVIYILRTRFGKFKGIARCMSPDIFDRDIGVRIAYVKAKRKELNARQKEINFINKMIYEDFKVLEKMQSKIWSEHNRLDNILDELGEL